MGELSRGYHARTLDAGNYKVYSGNMDSKTSLARDIYEAHVRRLPREVRLSLLSVIAEEITHEPAHKPTVPGAAIVRFADLAGLGAEVWEGVDPDAYIRASREEWDGRP